MEAREEASAASAASAAAAAAFALFRAGKYVQAAAELSRALSSLPAGDSGDGDAASRARRAQLLTNRAWTHLRIERFRSALGDATEALALVPSYSAALLCKARALRALRGAAAPALAALAAEAVESDSALDFVVREELEQICGVASGSARTSALAGDEDAPASVHVLAPTPAAAESSPGAQPAATSVAAVADADSGGGDAAPPGSRFGSLPSSAAAPKPPAAAGLDSGTRDAAALAPSPSAAAASAVAGEVLAAAPATGSRAEPPPLEPYMPRNRAPQAQSGVDGIVRALGRAGAGGDAAVSLGQELHDGGYGSLPISQLLSIGFACVNNGEVDEAIDVFDNILRYVLGDHAVARAQAQLAGGDVGSAAAGTGAAVADASAAEAQGDVSATSALPSGATSRPSINELVAMMSRAGDLVLLNSGTPEALSLARSQVYIGRGTACALLADLTQAERDYTRAIRVCPANLDAYKRRGHVRSVAGRLHDALSDFDQCVEMHAQLGMELDADLAFQRGSVLFKLRRITAARRDFDYVTKLSRKDAKALYQRGLCEVQMGDVVRAAETFKLVVQLEPENKEAHCNVAQAYRELGNYVQAMQWYDRAISFSKSFAGALNMRGLCNYSSGRVRAALRDYEACAALPDAPVEAKVMRGVCCQALGLFVHAVQQYEIVLREDQYNKCWYQRELAIYFGGRVNNPYTDVDVDGEVDPYFREGWCKSIPRYLLINYKQQSVQDVLAARALDIRKLHSAETKAAIALMAPFGLRLHQRAQGYFRNERQLRYAALSVVDVAQQLARAFQQLVPWAEAHPVDAARASASASSASALAAPLGGELPVAPASATWRKLCDVVVRWRQISEPNDPVVWVDTLPPEQFAEGFGSHTPLFTGHTKAVRYYPMFDRCLAVMKQHIAAQGQASGQALVDALAATDCASLYAAVNRDFWVVTPCTSARRPGHVMEGTRLTIVRQPDDGFEFSIRTPGTPPRTLEYVRELDWVWGLVLAHGARRAARAKRAAGSGATDDVDTHGSECVRLALLFSYFWFNFMPLSRGTASVGNIMLQAVLLAFGYETATLLPEGMLLDWEAIIAPTVGHYTSQIAPWISAASPDTVRRTDVLAHLKPLRAYFPTLGHAVAAFDIEVIGTGEPAARSDDAAPAAASR